MNRYEVERIIHDELGWDDTADALQTLSETSVREQELRLRDVPTDIANTTIHGPRRYKLDRGWTKHQLIHELAAQDSTITFLAQKYGVVHSAIINFRTRHQAEIVAVQQNLADRFASIPLARKENRLAEYQQDIDDINRIQDGFPQPELTRLKHGALKNMAEELGHLPSKTSIQVNNAQVSYAFEGVDLDKL